MGHVAESLACPPYPTITQFLLMTVMLSIIMLGIRYAKPPVGDLRFKRAEEYPPWDGVKDATEIGDACPQIDISGDIRKMLSFAGQ